MKKLIPIKNIVKLVAVILLLAMVFITPVNLKMNGLSDRSSEYLTGAAGLAAMSGHLSEKEYDVISDQLKALSGDILNDEQGDVEDRFEYSQSFFSMLLSIPDAITLIKGDLANTENIDVEAVVKAVNPSSIQTFMLFKGITLGFNLQEFKDEESDRSNSFLSTVMGLSPIITAIFLFFCMLVLPIKFFISGIKEIVAVVKSKGEWLTFASDKEDEWLKDAMNSMFIMLLTPVLLRGSSLTVYFIIFALLVVALIVMSVLVTAGRKKKPELRAATKMALIFLIAAVVISAIVCVMLNSYDVNKEVISNKGVWEELQKMATDEKGIMNPSGLRASLYQIRALVVFAAYLVIGYITETLRTISRINLAQKPDQLCKGHYILLVFISACVFFYGKITDFSANSTLCLVLCIVLFILTIVRAICIKKISNAKSAQKDTVEAEEN